MAFTTMHFAVGMAGAGAAGTLFMLLRRRGWRWLPMWMTAGGVWACVPDMPRVFREDFPNLPLAATLGDKGLERTLHAHGDWFFLHRMLDAQPRELALHGLLGILVFYTVSNFVLAYTHRGRRMRAPAMETAGAGSDIVGRITPGQPSADTDVA